MGIPVVVSPFGFPVRQVEGNAPVMTVSQNGLGFPIMLSDRGFPFVVEGVGPVPLPGSISDLAVLSTTTSTAALAFTDAARATSHQYRLDGGEALPLAVDKIVTGLDPESVYDVEVRGVNSAGDGEWSNIAEIVTEGILVAPVNTGEPSISGDPEIGSTLFADPGEWDNDPASFTYQWQIGAGDTWADISGATGSSYTPDDGEGEYLRVRVIASNGAGASDPSFSAPVGPLVAAQTEVPENVSVPEITGVAQVGVPLETTAGTWTNDPEGFAYQWQRNTGSWVNISGATSNEYTPTPADEGLLLRSQVIASNAVGPSVPAFSSATDAVEPASPLPAADYIVTNDGEWDIVMANDAATLSGKVVEIQGTGFSERVISNKDIPGAPLVIRSGDAESNLTRVRLFGAVSNIIFQNNFQMTGWPYTFGSMFHFDNGTFDDIIFDGASFRHGYGAGLVNLDMTADYPEYERVPNVRTATTTSTTTELDWQDASMPSAWIEFFNRGTETVYPNFGGADVTTASGGGYTAWRGAGSGVPGVPPGAKRRTTTLNPASITHMALITASGTSEVNARAEIGMSSYLSEAFTSSGAANIGNIEFRNCRFRDLNNAIKGIGRPTSSVIDRCDFDRIYQDLISYNIRNAYITRNMMGAPFARSGIAENLNGDARDPHGDMAQSLGQGTATYSNIVLAGNTTRRTARRAGVQSQGWFLSDNDINPSYDLVYSVSDILLAGAPNGINSGESGYPLGRAMVYAATVLNSTALGSGSLARVRINTDGNYNVLVSHTIAQNFLYNDQPYRMSNNLRTVDVASTSALFPNIGDLATANTREQIETAVTSAAEGAGLGAVAARGAIDYETDDATQVVRWGLVPSGLEWSDFTEVEPEDVLVTELVEVLNPSTGQPIIPGAGVRWRSFQNNGTTPVQAWTASSGTVSFGQKVQLEITAQEDFNTTEAFTASVNGFTQTVNVTTKIGDVDFEPRAAYFDGGDYFASTSTNIAAGGSGLVSLWFRLNALSWNDIARRLFQFRVGAAAACELLTASAGRLTLRLNNDTATDTVAFYAAQPGNIGFGVGEWHHVLIGWGPGGATIHVDGAQVATMSFTSVDMAGQEIAQAGVGSQSTGSTPWLGDIGHLYINLAETLDLSDPANIEKFIKDGSPVDLGANGELPTGNAPAFYYDGNAPTWINYGTAEALPLFGELTASSEAPAI